MLLGRFLNIDYWIIAAAHAHLVISMKWAGILEREACTKVIWNFLRIELFWNMYV